VNALKEKILRRIAREGPITVAQYMEMALYDPEHGYYMKGDPFGAKGDFITAPEVSQIFGELIGLWFVQVWEDRGQPKRFHFVELGPGRGTLMADMLRAARVRPAFLGAAKIVLVETSPALHAIQQRVLQDAKVRWCESLAGVPSDAPLFLIANEFLDALPVNQFVRTDDGWRQRMVATKDGNLVFVHGSKVTDVPLGVAPVGSIFERSTPAHGIVKEIAGRIATSGGTALLVDYGHEQSGLGDTLQAVKAHKYADPLANPGDADLTTHVDFGALAKCALQTGAIAFGPQPQGAFLKALGIGARADRLKRSNRDAASEIDRAVDRLTSPTQMGALFKIMAISEGRFPSLPGFQCSS
jgi:SAM-dependent MidA family methyltransferase